MENDRKNNIDVPLEKDEEKAHSDEERISILQWILLFLTLGIVAYFSPILMGFLPK